MCHILNCIHMYRTLPASQWSNFARPWKDLFFFCFFQKKNGRVISFFLLFSVFWKLFDKKKFGRFQRLIFFSTSKNMADGAWLNGSGSCYSCTKFFEHSKKTISNKKKTLKMMYSIKKEIINRGLFNFCSSSSILKKKMLTSKKVIFLKNVPF